MEYLYGLNKAQFDSVPGCTTFRQTCPEVDKVYIGGRVDALGTVGHLCPVVTTVLLNSTRSFRYRGGSPSNKGSTCCACDDTHVTAASVSAIMGQYSPTVLSWRNVHMTEPQREIRSVCVDLPIDLLACVLSNSENDGVQKHKCLLTQRAHSTTCNRVVHVSFLDCPLLKQHRDVSFLIRHGNGRTSVHK